MKAEEILKKNGLRVTKSRKEVLDLFTERSVALSAHDIEVSLPTADRVTMYRTLKTFEEKGIIHKAIDGTDKSRYAMCHGSCSEHEHHDNHVHFHCEDCKNTFCLEGAKVPDVVIPDAYKVKAINIVVNGKCEQCLK